MNDQIAGKVKQKSVGYRFSFADQYKHPLWQKLRLEILDRDGFSCLYCGSTETTLHVHHTFYSKNEPIFNAPEFSLVSVCENCHEAIHGIKHRILSYSGFVLWQNLINKEYQYRYSDVENLVAFLSGPQEEVPEELHSAVMKLREIVEDINSKTQVSEK